MINSIQHFWTRSIRRQLMLGIVLVHAILMSIFVVDLTERERQFLLNLSKDQAFGLAETLAANGSSWILAQDFMGIEEVIESQSGFPGLRYAMFTDLQGHVLGYTDREKVGQYVSDPISQTLNTASSSSRALINDAFLIDVAAPVVTNEKHIGWARVGISRASISHNLQIVTRNGLLYTLLAIGVGVIFASLMSRGLTSGILKITNLMHQVKQGKRQVDFTLDRKDELGILSRDMTTTMDNLHILEKKLQELYERTRVTLRSIGDGVITTHADSTVEYINPVAEQLTGWSNEQAAGKPLLQIFSISTNTSDVVTNHTTLEHRDGSLISIDESTAPIHDDHGNITGAVLVFRDVTDDRLLKENMNYQATHDALTDAWNRRAFEQKIIELQLDSKQSQSTHGLLYIDLDQFKVVNDTAGHSAGDDLLNWVISQFSNVIRSSDMLARLGGDEFGVLLPHCNEDHAKAAGEKIRSAIEQSHFFRKGKQYKISASIGIAMITRMTTQSEVLSQADLACYRAKELGRNLVHMFTNNDADLTARHSEMRWVSTINDALSTNRFVLYSQRIAAIAHKSTVEYREILVRMLGDNGEIIPPNAFIPAAERYDLMTKIDWIVINKACEWLRAQPEKKYRLSINLSGNSLGNLALLNNIEEKFKQAPAIASNICFEITETAAISNLPIALNFMDRLIKLGVEFSLDDFGSGLSSFSYLKKMPVSSLKIDGTFIKDISTDPVDAALVQAISQVSKKLNILTIAEFVEDEETLKLLALYGIDYAQGYHIEKPRPLSDL